MRKGRSWRFRNAGSIISGRLAARTMSPTALYASPFIARPGLKFLLRHPAHWFGMGFGLGLIPFAPGTFGTLLALPLFWALQPRLEPVDLLILIGFLYIAGIWFCDRTGRALGIEDHKGIVWDETVAFLMVLFFTPPTLAWQAFARVCEPPPCAGTPRPATHPRAGRQLSTRTSAPPPTGNAR